MAEQAIRAVNCPHCGLINKVVCPVANAEPKEVYAKSEWGILGHKKNEVACEHCGRKIFLIWYL